MAARNTRTASPSTGTAAAMAAIVLDEEDTSGNASLLGDVGSEAGDTSDAEALANSRKLGPSVRGKPVGMPKTIRIILEEAAGAEIPPTGLPVGLNGKAYLIRPGEEVDVPPGVVEILDNAIMHVAVTDPQTLKVIGHRKRLRFPYRRVYGNAA